MDRTLKSTIRSFALNLSFSAYHLLLGYLSKSWWLLTLGTYYLLLSAIRIFALRWRGKSVAKIAGAMLLLLCIPLAGTVILAAVKDRGQRLHEILMITVALYAFTKITLAILNLIKSRRDSSAKVVTLRIISLADAFVSIFALQRSMIVSFGGLSAFEILLFNIITGSAVWVIILLLGIYLIKK